MLAPVQGRSESPYCQYTSNDLAVYSFLIYPVSLHDHCKAQSAQPGVPAAAASVLARADAGERNPPMRRPPPFVQPAIISTFLCAWWIRRFGRPTAIAVCGIFNIIGAVVQARPAVG